MDDDLAFVDEIVTGFEARLVDAEAALDQFEGAVATLELAAQAVAGNDDALEEVLASVFARIQPEIERLIALPQPIVGLLTTLQADLQQAPGDVSAVVDGLDISLNEMLEGLSGETGTLMQAIENAVAKIEEATGERLTALTSEIDVLFDGMDDGIKEIEAVLDDVTDGIDKVRDGSLGAAVEFVDRIDNSLGRIVDGLEQIEAIVDPVMPVVSLLETVA